MLKLQALVPEIIKRMNQLDEARVKDFLRRGLEEHRYTNNYEVWAAACLRDAVWKSSEICDSYREYNCNDSHWISMIQHCARKMGWL